MQNMSYTLRLNIKMPTGATIGEVKKLGMLKLDALGASGGVSAVIFASILLNPTIHIGLIFIPGDGIPAWAFGPLYLMYCAYMARRGGDNIGHTAHLTGAVFGFIFPVIFAPHLLLEFFQQLPGHH